MISPLQMGTKAITQLVPSGKRLSQEPLRFVGLVRIVIGGFGELTLRRSTVSRVSGQLHHHRNFARTNVAFGRSVMRQPISTTMELSNASAKPEISLACLRRQIVASAAPPPQFHSDQPQVDPLRRLAQIGGWLDAAGRCGIPDGPRSQPILNEWSTRCSRLMSHYWPIRINNSFLIGMESRSVPSTTQGLAERAVVNNVFSTVREFSRTSRIIYKRASDYRSPENNWMMPSDLAAQRWCGGARPAVIAQP
ncbi:hypothetical protein EMPG_14834 [Blastomyces silverae]|uniref:Uncharacterized protein n=1 Tax=Blastomyces silverae TaxID=2060906 RepID=A0A0H1BKN3_9EURO|nr:hypothetical protein EMPG_14834 [Blastomyces silverae]